MSDSLVKIFGIAILGALFAIIIRKWNSDISLLFRIAVGIALCVGCMVLISPLIDTLRQIGEAADMSAEASKCISVLLRALFIALLSHICATICRDCGESSIAYYAELGGKIEIMLLSLPLLLDIMELTLQLVQMSE